MSKDYCVRKFIFIVMLLYSYVGVAFGTEGYYVELYQQAKENISVLPEAKLAEYEKMLDEYNDVFMAFILAKEESSKLLRADPNAVKSHHRQIKELWESNTDKYSLPFFLSYIAKITVTEERLTPYRDVFRYWGLYELSDMYTEESDLVRELNLWCRRFMTFKSTSGRDLAPVDIIERTNLGRCEEMQIFFIAAARSLGIPARPASTRFWAHTDNNHAWVEVYVNGEWRYLGAVEPEYELDQAWFSANVSKAIMITATAAFPDSSDIVLVRDKYHSTINSTPNYFSNEEGIRTLKITTTDADGSIIPEADFMVNVFNWGMIRPILRTKTNELGEYEITAGNGAFWVSAHKDGLFALQLIEARDVDDPAQVIQDSSEVRLVLQNPANMNSSRAELHYREREVHREPPADDWQQRRDKVVEEYSQIVSEYLEKPFPEAEADPLLVEVWKRSRNNQDRFFDFCRANKPISEGFLQMLTQIDEKFLWQANLNQFDNLHKFYLESEHLEYPEEIMVRLISPTSMFEELPENSLSVEYTRWREEAIELRIQSIISYLNDNYQIDDSKSVLSLLPYDRLIDLEYHTAYQYKMLACALLKANFIPAVYVNIPDVVAVYFDQEWKYYDIVENRFLTEEQDENTERLTYVTVSVADEFGYPVILENNQFTLAYLHDGLFYPTQKKFEVNQEGVLEAYLAEGLYFLHIGYRPSNSLTIVNFETLEVQVDQPLAKSVTLYEYPRKWNELSEELAELLEAVNIDYLYQIVPQADVETVYVLFGNYDQEPVRRIAERLENRAPEGSFVLLGTSQSSEEPSYYRESAAYEQWLIANEQFRQRTFTVALKRSENKLSYFEGFWENLPEE
jgi:hypothetical protein